MILPFGVLLGVIALAPLACPHWWEKHYPKVALSLGAVTLVYYCFFLPPPARHTVLHTGLEYVSFIALIGSLFVVSGGIHIGVRGESTPMENTIFLAVGAVIANLLGTTGASMLLIRPWIRKNKYRITQHHIVFFIFIISNVGGCLTPIGDPPLFLGYLRGIPFWWVLKNCWLIWLVGTGLLLAVFYVIDSLNYRRAPKPIRDHLAEPSDKFSFQGLGNLVFLGVILGAVFISKPAFLREALMVGAAAGSWFLTRKSIHEANHFNFHPIREVAILFAGIFATMMPALDYLRLNAGQMGNPSPTLYYWGTGVLSSFLDNAPTYLTFLSASMGAFAPADIIQQVQALLAGGGAPDLAAVAGPGSDIIRNTVTALQANFPAAVAGGKVTADQIRICVLLGNPAYNQYVIAISVAAVFFGANTYIGNGPNFMVKSIAHQQRVHAPGFIGYVVKFALPIMAPVLLVVWLLFFRG